MCLVSLFMQCTSSTYIVPCKHVDHIISFHALFTISFLYTYNHVVSYHVHHYIIPVYIQSCCLLSCSLSLLFMYYISYQVISSHSSQHYLFMSYTISYPYSCQWPFHIIYQVHVYIHIHIKIHMHVHVTVCININITVYIINNITVIHIYIVSCPVHIII